jgi:2-oxoisovalerate dehydrogenase E1 component
MTKTLFIDPAEVRKPGSLSFTDIPVNQYKRTIREETDRFSREDFLRIYHDMKTLRTFESMLLTVKTSGGFEGIPYEYPGPATERSWPKGCPRSARCRRRT